jgi:glyoxylase-like metal-dependent hydrolase (beta-lactamase superfamily II)
MWGQKIQFGLAVAVLIAWSTSSCASGPAYVDITWMSITNTYYELGKLGIVTDGYFTRIPHAAFLGGGSGLARTRQPYKPDMETIRRVLKAIGGPSHINVLLTGHSHFDHSFDIGAWASLTRADIFGPPTTCFQVQAENIPAKRCHALYGHEAIHLSEGVTMRVVRWNHSGDPARNPEQHNPVELTAIPHPDPTTGGLRPGVTEDFPNGGGTRAFLFIVDGPRGRFSWFYQDSASAIDLDVPIVVDGINYGAPIENLKTAMKDAGIDSVDLWIATGGAAVAKLVLPVLRPKAYIPTHFDDYYAPFLAGLSGAFSDQELEDILAKSNVKLITPRQYMDKWRLDRHGMRPLANTAVKKALGLSEVQTCGKSR